MPVLLDRGQFKPILLGSPSCASLSDFADHRTIEIALINNMPDAAIEATERQFAALLAASVGANSRAAEESMHWMEYRDPWRRGVTSTRPIRQLTACGRTGRRRD